jgi:hypothetical protein
MKNVQLMKSEPGGENRQARRIALAASLKGVSRSKVGLAVKA